ncbi:MAG: hypothetical protein R8J84_04735 [Mariprofundales bacterium]
MHASLNARGRAVSRGLENTGTSNEKEARKGLVDNDLIEALGVTA